MSQEDIKVAITLEFINTIDPIIHVCRKLEYKYVSSTGHGRGFKELISYEVTNLKVFQHDTIKKLTLLFYLFLKDLFDKGFYDETLMTLFT